MFDPDETVAYTVHAEASQFTVMDWEGNVAMVCGDAQSAEQYAVMMSRAFRCGYKVGFRTGRKI